MAIVLLGSSNAPVVVSRCGEGGRSMDDYFWDLLVARHKDVEGGYHGRVGGGGGGGHHRGCSRALRRQLPRSVDGDSQIF